MKLNMMIMDTSGYPFRVRKLYGAKHETIIFGANLENLSLKLK